MKEKQIEEMAKILGSDCGDCQECEYYRVRVKEGINACYFKYAEMLYNAGYREQEWISVEERLPDAYSHIIACDKFGTVGEAVYFGEGWYGKGWFEWVDEDAPIIATHWMPLPEPPKGENEE